MQDQSLTIRVARAIPGHVIQRLRQLNTAARRCYQLRNAATLQHDPGLAADYQAVGDAYFARAHALLAEWDA